MILGIFFLRLALQRVSTNGRSVVNASNNRRYYTARVQLHRCRYRCVSLCFSLLRFYTITMYNAQHISRLPRPQRRVTGSLKMAGRKTEALVLPSNPLVSHFYKRRYRLQLVHRLLPLVPTDPLAVSFAKGGGGKKKKKKESKTRHAYFVTIAVGGNSSKISKLA